MKNFVTKKNKDYQNSLWQFLTWTSVISLFLLPTKNFAHDVSANYEVIQDLKISSTHKNTNTDVSIKKSTMIFAQKKLEIKIADKTSHFLLEPMPSVFTDNALIEIIGSEKNKIHKAQALPPRSFWTRPTPQSPDWAVMTFDQNNALRGLFTINHGKTILQLNHVNQLQLSASDLTQDKAQALAELPKDAQYLIHDVATVKIPQLDWQCGHTGDSEENSSDNNSTPTDPLNPNDPSNSTNPSATSPYLPFFPGCYSGDALTHQLEVGIAVDVGYFKAASSSVNNVMLEIESMVAMTRIIYLQQLNILLKVGKVVIADGSAPTAFPLNMDPAANNCSDDNLSVLNQLALWNATTNAQVAGNEKGFWHLLTNCWPAPGVVGIGYIGSLCTQSNNVGISSRTSDNGASTWMIYGHETGHGLGALHTFGFGGIMDYGNRSINGVVQFYSANQAQICPVINSKINSCSYLTTLPADATCGNGVLEKAEACECLSFGSKDCGKCQNCQIADAKIHCSNQDFVMRVSAADFQNDIIPVDSKHLSDATCCTKNGEILDATTTCDSNGNICSMGKCTRFCTAYALAPCATSNQGCKQPCAYSKGGQCYPDLKTQTLGIPISWMPDGSSCNQGKGICQQGNCDSVLPPTPVPTPIPPVPTPMPTPPVEPSPNATPGPNKNITSGGYAKEGTACRSSVIIKGKTINGCIPMTQFKPFTGSSKNPPRKPTNSEYLNAWCFTGTGPTYSAGQKSKTRFAWGYCGDSER